MEIRAMPVCEKIHRIEGDHGSLEFETRAREIDRVR